MNTSASSERRQDRAPTIALIAAMDRNRLIGQGNAMPWHLPADLKHFRAVTWGKPMVMGRRTYQSLGRPLPGRTNIVVSRDPEFRAAGVIVARSLDEALARAAEAAGAGGEIMGIGGANLYAQLLPRAQRLYLTQIDAELKGDAWFPPFDPGRWREVSREAHPAGEGGADFGYSFVELVRDEVGHG
jgi:dihydrofolate reductase